MSVLYAIANSNLITTLINCFVILSKAKNLEYCVRFFALLRMTKVQNKTPNYQSIFHKTATTKLFAVAEILKLF